MSKIEDDAVEIARARQLIRSGAAKSIRLAAGLNRGELGRAVGVVSLTIRRWEDGERMPRGKNAIKYGRVLRRLMGSKA